MNRRELLKAAMVFHVNRRLAMKAFAMESSSKYIVFFSPMLMGPDFGKQFMADHPGSSAYPVSGDIDEAIRLFKQG